MRRKLWRLLPTAITIPAVVVTMLTISAAQPVERRVMTFEKGQVFLLPELGAVILQGDDGLYIEMAPPPNNRPRAYRDVDLQEKDVIIMFNGKRMKTIADIQDRYDSLGIGDEIKFGIKRGPDMRLVSLAKMDQSQIPQTRQIMLGGEADSLEARTTGAPQREMMMSWKGGTDTKLDALPELGVVLTEEDSTVVVASILPNAAAIFKEYTPAEGDELKAIGDHQVSSTKSFHELYEKIAVGETVTLHFVRDGKETVVSVAKPEPAPQKMIIQKKG